MSAKPSISISDLQSGAKRLNSCDADNKTSHSDQKSSFDSAALVPLEELYHKHDGNLDEIFGELKANPAKAKKPHHKPKNAKEFAEKYLAGYYSIVSDEETSADAKGHK